MFLREMFAQKDKDSVFTGNGYYIWFRINTTISDLLLEKDHFWKDNFVHSTDCEASEKVECEL